MGLRRAGFKASEVSTIKAAYMLLIPLGLKLDEALARIEAEVPTGILYLVEFIRGSNTRDLPQ